MHIHTHKKHIHTCHGVLQQMLTVYVCLNDTVDSLDALPHTYIHLCIYECAKKYITRTYVYICMLHMCVYIYTHIYIEKRQRLRERHHASML